MEESKYQRLHDDSQRRTDNKLVQDDRKHYCWLCLSSNGEGRCYKVLTHASWTYERGLQVLHNKCALSDIKYYKLDLYKFCIMGSQCRVAFSTSQHKTKGLLDIIHMDVWGSSLVASIRVLGTMLHSYMGSP